MPVRRQIIGGIEIPDTVQEVSDAIVVDTAALALSVAAWPATFIETAVIDDRIRTVNYAPDVTLVKLRMGRTAETDLKIRTPYMALDGLLDYAAQWDGEERRPETHMIPFNGSSFEGVLQRLGLGAITVSPSGQDVTVDISHIETLASDWLELSWDLTVHMRFGPLINSIIAGRGGERMGGLQMVNMGRISCALQAAFLSSHHAGLANAMYTSLSTSITRRRLVETHGMSAVHRMERDATITKAIKVLPQHMYKPRRGVYDPAVFDHELAEKHTLTALRWQRVANAAGELSTASVLGIELVTIPMPPTPKPIAHDTFEMLPLRDFTGVSEALGQFIYYNWQVGILVAEHSFETKPDFTIRFNLPEGDANVAVHLPAVFDPEIDYPLAEFHPYTVLSPEHNSALTHGVSAWSIGKRRVTVNFQRNAAYNSTRLMTEIEVLDLDLNQLHGTLLYYPDYDEARSMPSGVQMRGILPGATTPYGWIAKETTDI